MGAAFSFEESSGDFPSTGKSMSVTVQCSHGGQSVSFAHHRGNLVTSDWTTTHVQQVIEAMTGIHKCSQMLMFGGRCAEKSDTLQTLVGVTAEAMPDRLKLFMIVDRTTFPQKLGPFATVALQLPAKDFILPEVTEELRTSGFYWEMLSSSLAKQGLHARTKRITGQLSPLYPITADMADREACGIPEEAEAFAWSYAIANWESVESDAYLLDAWEDHMGDSDRLKSFLSVGGFLYFDAETRVVGATTVGKAQPSDDSVLNFTQARRWAPEWTRPLVEQGRFQTITMKRLRDIGARKYLWLRPNEVIEGKDGKPLPMQPDVPHGGFVYLFHDGVISMDPAETALDRYFPVASGPVPLDPGEEHPLTLSEDAESSPFRAFTLVDRRTSLSASQFSRQGSVLVQTVAETPASPERPSQQPGRLSQESSCNFDEQVKVNPRRLAKMPSTTFAVLKHTGELAGSPTGPTPSTVASGPTPNRIRFCIDEQQRLPQAQFLRQSSQQQFVPPP